MPEAFTSSTEAQLTFIARASAKPRVVMSANHADENQRTGDFRSMVVPIYDARTLPEPPKLDREGFELVRDRTDVHDFYEASIVERAYYPAIVRLLKRVTGATEAYVFDHTVRIQDEQKRRTYGTRLPVLVAHNDYTEASGLRRAESFLDQDVAAKVLAHRWAMVNAWRSIGISADRAPLAVADGRTVDSSDFVAVDLVYPDRVGEIYYATHSAKQLWFYFPRIHRDEVILLKCFDSAHDGRTRYTLHTAFANASASSDTPPRESIEVRALLSFANCPQDRKHAAASSPTSD